MGFMDLIRRKEERSSIEDPTVPVSASNFLAFFGVQTTAMPGVTIDSALGVPAVGAAVAFLSRTLASLPLHAYRDSNSGPVRLGGKVKRIIHDAPNPQMASFKFYQYMWQQVFTGGRMLAWIERNGPTPDALWPIDPTKTTVKRVAGRIFYTWEGREYPAEDVIDVPFMLKSDMLSAYGPIVLGAKTISAAIAMNDYTGNFFNGGGVPPLALVGPAPSSQEGFKRAQEQINKAIKQANASKEPIFPIPLGHELKQVGFDPDKGQMTEAQRFYIEEIARIYQIPPVFLQDLSRATFSNAEQQDLHLVKHLIGQWAKALETEMNLKLFPENSNRYVEYNMDGLMRGDFKSRIEGIARGIQSGFMTPNEGRKLEGRPDHSNPSADELFVQGATVPLGTVSNNGGANDPGTTGTDDTA